MLRRSFFYFVALSNPDVFHEFFFILFFYFCSFIYFLGYLSKSYFYFNKMPTVFINFERNETISRFMCSFSQSRTLIAGKKEFSLPFWFISRNEMYICFFIQRNVTVDESNFTCIDFDKSIGKISFLRL